MCRRTSVMTITIHQVDSEVKRFGPFLSFFRPGRTVVTVIHDPKGERVQLICGYFDDPVFDRDRIWPAMRGFFGDYPPEG